MKAAIEMENDFEVCGEAEQGRNAAERIIDCQTDVALIDLNLEDYHGLNVIKDLRAQGFEGSILVISMHDENLYAQRSLDAGAQGYVAKNEASELVVDAIREVSSGEFFLSPRAYKKMLKRTTKTSLSNWAVSPRVLSDRQLEVFELTGKGLCTNDISLRMGIDEKTAQAHYRQIKEKLSLKTMREVIVYAAVWVATQGEQS